MTRLGRWRLLVLLAGAVFAADFLASVYFSGKVSRSLAEQLNRHASLRIAFRDMRIHPLFLSITARDFEMFDPDHPDLRILSARRVRGHWDLTALIVGRVSLADIHFYSVELRVIKDVHGVFNLEKIALPKAGAEGEEPRFYGWKHSDWLYNVYERLKHAVRPNKEALIQKTVPEQKLLFRIGRAVFHDGRVILTDRKSKPLLFHQVEIRADVLEWYAPEGVVTHSVSARGLFKAGTNGPFSVTVRRKPGQVEALAVASNIDLAALRPFYQKTSPVFFERGLLTIRSRTVFAEKNLQSENHLRITDFYMKPTVGWSPQSQTVLNALNSHKDLPLQFTLAGDPSAPKFYGFEDSFVNILKKDFDALPLGFIRRRLSFEVERLEARFTG